MTISHDSSHLRRAASAAAFGIHTVWLLIACATVVEEPTSMSGADTNAGLVSTADGFGSTTTATTTVTHTATITATSSVTSTTGVSATTNGVATSGEVVTSTSASSSTLTTTATASATLSSSTVSSTTTASSTGGAGGATTGSFATTVTDGAGGSTASTTTATNSTTGGTSEYCDDPLTPAEHVAADGATGAFDTTDGVCFRIDFVPADFAGWGCSNFQASAGTRTILVNGTSVTCGELPLPEPVDGGYFFDFGAGTNVSASMYWWNWE